MDSLKNISIGFGIAVLLSLAVYFFYIVPESNKAESKIEQAYKKGYADCSKEIDTVYVKGKDSLIYRDTSFTATEPVNVNENDSSLTLIASFDTAYVSGKDLIGVQTTAVIEVRKDSLGWDTKNLIAQWFSRIEHRDYERIDSVKITIPKIVERVEIKTNWLVTLIAFIGGILTAVIIMVL